MPKSKPIITVCNSNNFNRQAVDAQAVLEKQGYKAIIPLMAEEMKISGDFDVSHYKTWLVDPNDFDKKAERMHEHFDEVDKAEAILVLNYEKNGKPNYIGGNVLMEMALAFHQRKPIFVLNELPKESAYLEELHGMRPVILDGKIENFDKEFKKIK